MPKAAGGAGVGADAALATCASVASSSSIAGAPATDRGSNPGSGLAVGYGVLRDCGVSL
jgi:hypothetical protein